MYFGGCGILCNSDNLLRCSGCELYIYALEYYMIDFYEDIFYAIKG